MLSCQCHDISYRCDSVCVIMTLSPYTCHLVSSSYNKIPSSNTFSQYVSHHHTITTHHISVTVVTRSMLACHQGEWPDRGSAQGSRRHLQQQGSNGRSDRHPCLNDATIQGCTEESAASSRTITGRRSGEDG